MDTVWEMQALKMTHGHLAQAPAGTEVMFWCTVEGCLEERWMFNFVGYSVLGYSEKSLPHFIYINSHPPASNPDITLGLFFFFFSLPTW